MENALKNLVGKEVTIARVCNASKVGFTTVSFSFIGILQDKGSFYRVSCPDGFVSFILANVESIDGMRIDLFMEE